MKRLVRIISALFLAVMLGTATVYATPSTTYWTTSVIDVQPYKVWHLGIDNYFTVLKDDPDAGAFPTDVGLTVGVLPYEKIQLEVGVDLLENMIDSTTGKDNPLFFNFKFGTPEGSLFPGSPGIAAGMWNIGTKSGVTDYNIFHAMVGKSIPQIGRVHIGAYSGNKDLLKSSTGEEEATGFMIGWDRWLVKDKFMLDADYASGDNAIGAGGFGLYWFFAPNASMLMGPVFFNDDGINGEWKWTTQLDVNF
ncbi:MAG: hypothetical protein HZA12_04265 [Nitrospirae bacterium]|nr:hypothetical protein [Nitrospirota bacterium]